MKKILILLLLFVALPSFAGENLSFIYINGSNNNDIKMKNWYEKGVQKLHPVLRKKFLKNSFIKKQYNKELTIKKEPVIFFWGDKSKADLDYVKAQLEISKMVSSSGAYIVRNLISQYLHDAIWVQKTHNMLPILDELNEYIKKETKTGEAILFGYSAGTFVTYEYMFNKLRFIDVEKLFVALDAGDDLIEFAQNNPVENTCISAVSNYLGIFNSDGHLILNPKTERLKEKYLEMNKRTEEVCAPKEGFKGVVNFANPLPLFYSDITDKNYGLNYYNKLMAKYIMENGIYWLTVNFKEDPLGFPTSRNLTVGEMEENLDLKIENPTGVIYDNSGVWSKRIFPLAHTSYWSARGTFSKGVVKTFVNGYKFQYDEKFQQKTIKQNKKKSEL